MLTLTANELAAFDGEKKCAQRILVCVCGVLFDVSSHPTGAGFYGVKGPYHVFAGKDASIGLALLELDERKWPASTRVLTAENLEGLLDWLKRFATKYQVAGTLAGVHAVPKLVDGKLEDAEEWFSKWRLLEGCSSI